MAASIGAVSCDFVRGTISLPSQILEVWHTPGLDGLGVQLLGRGNSMFEVEAVKIDTVDNLETWRDALIAETAKMITIETDDGQITAGCQIADMRQTPARRWYQPGETGDPIYRWSYLLMGSVTQV